METSAKNALNVEQAFMAMSASIKDRCVFPDGLISTGHPTSTLFFNYHHFTLYLLLIDALFV